MSRQYSYKKRHYQSPKYGVYIGLVNSYDRNIGVGTIAFISKDDYGERQEFKVDFDVCHLRARNYDLNEGEKVMFRLVKRNHRDIVVDIIPLSLEDLLKKDMQEQIKARLSKLDKKVESEGKRRF